MEQKGFIKNISGTVCVLGLALSTVSMNSTMIINGTYKIPNANYSYNENSSNPIDIEINNIYRQKDGSRLENIATELFGSMRDATQEEQASVNNYIESISKDTGVNFFDLC